MSGQLMLWPDDSPRVRASDPISSHEAADATARSVAASQRAVAWIFENEGHPLTVAQLKERANRYGMPWSDSRLQSVPSELEEMGVLERDGYVRPDGATRRLQVWRLKDAA